MKKVVIIVFLTVIFLTGCSEEANSNIKFHEKPDIDIMNISYEEVKGIIDNYDSYDDIVIIDVRSEIEFDDGHIEKAINLPVELITNIDVDKDKKIIVYCRSGRRSNQAATILIGLGYERVFDMGGIDGWPYEILSN